MDFRFTHIFNQDATQENVFDRVAKPVIMKYFILFSYI